MAADGSVVGSVRVWELARGRELLELRDAHVKAVISVAFRPDGKRLVTGGVWLHKPALLELWPGERDGGPRSQTEPKRFIMNWHQKDR